MECKRRIRRILITLTISLTRKQTQFDVREANCWENRKKFKILRWTWRDYSRRRATGTKGRSNNQLSALNSLILSARMSTCSRHIVLFLSKQQSRIVDEPGWDHFNLPAAIEVGSIAQNYFCLYKIGVESPNALGILFKGERKREK